MLKVHFTPGTRAGRVVWLLEELDLDYDVNIMPFTKEGLKSQSIKLWAECRFLKMVIYQYLKIP